MEATRIDAVRVRLAPRTMSPAGLCVSLGAFRPDPRRDRARGGLIRILGSPPPTKRKAHKLTGRWETSGLTPCLQLGCGWLLAAGLEPPPHPPPPGYRDRIANINQTVHVYSIGYGDHSFEPKRNAKIRSRRKTCQGKNTQTTPPSAQTEQWFGLGMKHAPKGKQREARAHTRSPTPSAAPVVRHRQVGGEKLAGDHGHSGKPPSLGGADSDLDQPPPPPCRLLR